jgi:hypothetical protein
VLRTTGGLPGFRNLLVRVPHVRRVIILLSNVRGPVDRFDAIAVRAVENYEKVLQLDPENENAKAMLRKLRNDH